MDVGGRDRQAGGLPGPGPLGPSQPLPSAGGEVGGAPVRVAESASSKGATAGQHPQAEQQTVALTGVSSTPQVPIKALIADGTVRVAADMFKRLVAQAKTPESKPDVRSFNQAADALRRSRPDGTWKQGIHALFYARDNLPGFVKVLSSLQDVDLRGYDREALHALFSVLLDHVRFANPPFDPPVDTAALQDKAALYSTLVLTVPDEQMEYLGVGAVNQVFSVKFTGENGLPATGVFKPDPSEAEQGGLSFEKVLGTAVASGIPAGAEAHLPARAVASYIVDRHLFGEGQVSVKTEYVVVNGKRGILMEAAVGGSPRVEAEVAKSISLAANPAFARLLSHLNKKAGREPSNIKDLTQKDLRFIAMMSKRRRVEKRQDPATKQWSLVAVEAKLTAGKGAERYEVLTPDNAKTAEGMLKMQVFDWITGQVDRHPENYFVGPDGAVRLIDNDCSFGVDAVPERGDVRKQGRLKFIVPNNGSLMLRMPPVVTAELKDQICRLAEEGVDGLVADLQSQISAKEVGATLLRLRQLHQHVLSDACTVVPSSADLLKGSALAKMDSNNSYWQRERLVYASNKDNWNYLREHRDY